MTSVARIASADGTGPDSPGLVSDCRLMLSFARKNAFVLPPPLLHEIGWLDSVLIALGMAPVSQVSTRLIWPIVVDQGPPLFVSSDLATDTADPPLPAGAAAPAGKTPEEVILEVHSRLSLLIAPTTALSLQTSEPPAGKRHIFGGMPPLVQYVIVIAFISAICFVVSASKIASKSVNAKAAAAVADAASAAAKAASDAAANYFSPNPTPVAPAAKASEGAKP